MATGKVKSFDYSTGSGLIKQDNGGGDVIVHFSAVKSKSQRTLKAGQRVQFELGRGTAGLRATNVEIFNDFPAVAPNTFGQSVSAAPSNPNPRKKTKLWPFAVGGVATLGALFVALGSRQSAPSSQPTTAATPTAHVIGVMSKSATLKPMAKKTGVIAMVPSPLQGEEFAQTRLRELSPEEASNLTPQQVQYALNEIYARHGYIFANSGPRKQFKHFAWYKPVVGQSEVVSWQKFSALEKRNAQILNGVRTTRREEQAQQEQIAQSYKAEQKRLAEEEQQQRVAQQQVAQTRQNEPDSRSDSREFDSSDSASDAFTSSAQTPDHGASDDTTPTGFPIFTGPRGGRFHISKNGNKVYEKR